VAQPVWVLSVDLQTKTATFQTGMADAARSARDAFKDIKQGADDMGAGVGEAASATNYSMTEARHGVMMLGEEFGVHLPRGLTTFIASLGPVGAAMEMAFPFLAIILGATLLIEHLTKVGEAAEKAADAGSKFANDMALSGNKAELAYVDAEIQIRKLAGLDAWDLLAQKLQLKDAIKGEENLNDLEKKLKELIEANGATSNWNPFNWLDHSDELSAKAKTLKAEMNGKSETDQASIAQNQLTIELAVLDAKKKSGDASAAELKNQQAYVDFLKQETAELQHQADTAVLVNQAQQGKDRDDKIKKAEEEQEKLYQTQQRGLDRRLKIEADYAKKVIETQKKEASEAEKIAEEQYSATSQSCTHPSTDFLRCGSRTNPACRSEALTPRWGPSWRASKRGPRITAAACCGPMVRRLRTAGGPPRRTCRNRCPAVSASAANRLCQLAQLHSRTLSPCPDETFRCH
jgi:hypothetical protein